MERSRRIGEAAERGARVRVARAEAEREARDGGRAALPAYICGATRARRRGSAVPTAERRVVVPTAGRVAPPIVRPRSARVAAHASHHRPCMAQ